MAIRFDKDLNRYIKRKVDAFNKRLKRAEARGLKYLPSKLSIKQVKEQFSTQHATRREMRRKLEALDKFNLKNATKMVNLKSGEKTSKYLYNEAMRKRKRLIKLYEKKANEQKRFVRYEYPSTKANYQMYEERLKSLRKPIESRDDIRKYKRYYNNEYSAEKLDNFYQHTLDAIEQEMKFAEFPEEKKNYILNKLRTTSPDVLLKIYRNHPVFNVIDIRYTTDGQYTKEDEEVFADLYENLYNNIDDIINEYTFEDYEIL